MPDAFVQALNQAGYQAVFLPQAGVEPPELYNGHQGKLIRRGWLGHYSADIQALRVSTSGAPSLKVKTTTRKGAAAAASFLGRALQCLGAPVSAGIDLSFLERTGLVFSFEDVSRRSVDPAALDKVLQTIPRDMVPQQLIDNDELHIAYEYLYARKLLVTRVAARRTEAELAKHLDAFLDMKASAEVSLENASTISFTSRTAPAAFAYKAGQLRLNTRTGRWEFFPEVIRGSFMGGDDALETGPYLPCPGAAIMIEPPSELVSLVRVSQI